MWRAAFLREFAAYAAANLRGAPDLQPMDGGR
jgi:hypothetical protein